MGPWPLTRTAPSLTLRARRARRASLAPLAPPAPALLRGAGAGAGAAGLAPSVLPGQMLRRLIERGQILVPGAGAELFRDPSLLGGRLQAASLDLRLARRAWRVRASFLPSATAPVSELVPALASHEMRLDEGAVLEVGGVYIAELQESLALPPGLSARASAKSSVGRLNLFTRLIAEHGPSFDAVPEGYRGRLYCEIAPCAFPVLAREGDCLNALRVFAGRPAPLGESRLSADLLGAGLAGFRARRHTDVVDLRAEGSLDPRRFWDPLRAENGRLVLDPDAFYILVSEPGVRLAADAAGELAPFEAEMGEFRVHYAGFFDPGFGMQGGGADKGGGGRAVLEVRSHEVPFALEHGQAVGRLVSYPLAAAAETDYGARPGPSYQGQGLALSRHFAPWQER